MIIFDDKKQNLFFPLTLNRSVGDLRCGILKLRQRLEELLDAEDTTFWIDPDLQDLYKTRHPDWKLNEPANQRTLMVNSRLKPSSESINAIKDLKPNQGLVQGDDLIAFYAPKTISELPVPLELKAAGIELIPSQLTLYQNLSELINDNERLIRLDFEQFFYDQDNYFETEPGVTVLNPYYIWIGENVSLNPGCVLDASEGPIIIDEGTNVLPNAVICGPAYIGKKSLIKVGAKIYGGTSIGPVCKVGGEVEESIIQAYSNKQHDGFLGHSYIGEWVNIGAGSSNSDLKNTYKNVKFYSYASGEKIDSGTMFLGSMVGDYVKLGINTSVNTGCVIGFGCNLWSSDLIADFIPDFSWGRASQLTKYRFEAFCETAQLVKKRRGLELSPEEIALFKKIWELNNG